MDLDKLKSLAADEFVKHQLIGWTFGLSRAKRRLGVCRYQEKRIEIAGYYAFHTPEEHVIDTLRHEIAHALAGPKAGHGPEWKAIAVKLGVAPRACDNSAETVVRPGLWQATCPACQRIHHKYKRPRALTGYTCRCPGSGALTFAFQGNAGYQSVPASAAQWQAQCEGCGTLHRRLKPPPAGKWRCRCYGGGELSWRFVADESPLTPGPPPAKPGEGS